VGHGRKFRTHGHLALPLRHREHRSVKHWVERHGVLFPEHVQRRALWVDTGGIPGTDQGNRGWTRKLLGSPVQHRLTVDCCGPPCEEFEFSFVLGRSGGLCLHNRDNSHADQVDGGAELLVSNQVVGWMNFVACKRPFLALV